MRKKVPITDDGWRFLVAVLKAAGYGTSRDGWEFHAWNNLLEEIYRLENPEGKPSGTVLPNIRLRIQRLCPGHDNPAAGEPTIEELAQLEGLNLPAVHKAHDHLFRSIVDPKSRRISVRLLLLRLTTSNAVGTKPVGGEFLKEQDSSEYSLEGSPQVAVFVSSFAGNSRIGFEPVEKAAQVRAGQLIRIKIKLVAPAYIYLFWIRPNGEVQPVFPWTPGEWEGLSEENEVPLVSLELPKRDKDGKVEDWTLEDTAGLETVVVFTRKHRLTPNERVSLKADFDQLDSTARLPLITGLNMHVFQGKGAGARLKFGGRKTKDAAGARHAQIEKRLIAWCHFASCLSFVNAGRSK